MVFIFIACEKFGQFSVPSSYHIVYGIYATLFISWLANCEIQFIGSLFFNFEIWFMGQITVSISVFFYCVIQSFTALFVVCVIPIFIALF